MIGWWFSLQQNRCKVRNIGESERGRISRQRNILQNDYAKRNWRFFSLLLSLCYASPHARLTRLTSNELNFLNAFSFFNYFKKRKFPNKVISWSRVKILNVEKPLLLNNFNQLLCLFKRFWTSFIFNIFDMLFSDYLIAQSFPKT